MTSWIDNIVADGQHAVRLRNDLEYFAGSTLRLRSKAGPIEPLLFNAAQRKLHEIIEEQKRKTGRVRVIVLKARQMGVSTYVAARFYAKTIHAPGIRTLIVGHERRASSNLFEIVKRFHDGLPEDIRPSVGVSNAESLVFDKLDSGYLVSVATTEGAGRSATAQLLHASEAAFWVDLPVQMASLMQTVPDLDSTEIIIESTAFGINAFNELWRKAEAGEGEFLPVFLPWFTDSSYRRAVDADFEMDGEERQLAELYGLDAEQIAWRRAKILQIGDRFPQEYPSTASEAFISSDFDSFIPAALVIKAQREEVEPYGELILGVDPAGQGPDRMSIAWRRGSVITKIESRRGLDTTQAAGWVARIILDDKPVKVNIDVGGLGVGIYDRLIEAGHSRSLVNAVNFGSKPIEPPPFDETGKPSGGPANRRAEMWSNLKTVLEAGRFQLPDTHSLRGDLVSVGYKYTPDGKLLLESKQDMRRRGVPSPDEGDAVALCFSEIDGSPLIRSSNFNRKLEYPKVGLI